MRYPQCYKDLSTAEVKHAMTARFAIYRHKWISLGVKVQQGAMVSHDIVRQANDAFPEQTAIISAWMQRVANAVQIAGFAGLLDRTTKVTAAKFQARAVEIIQECDMAAKLDGRRIHGSSNDKTQRAVYSLRRELAVAGLKLKAKRCGTKNTGRSNVYSITDIPIIKQLSSLLDINTAPKYLEEGKPEVEVVINPRRSERRQRAQHFSKFSSH